jgi:hypothetical protein
MLSKDVKVSVNELYNSAMFDGSPLFRLSALTRTFPSFNTDAV